MMSVNIYGRCAVVMTDLESFDVYGGPEIERICSATDNPHARVSQVTREVIQRAQHLGNYDDLATAVQAARKGGGPPASPPAPSAPIEEPE